MIAGAARARPCPLCGAAGIPLRAVDYALFDDSHLPRSTSVERCACCGFVFANSDASPEDYVRHYQHNSIYAATDIRPGTGESTSDSARLRAAAARIAPRLSAQDLFIDIGAGGGGLLRAVVATTGCSAIGLDPDAQCVEAMKGGGSDARQATLQVLPAELHNRARVVALSHVLEHLWEPVEGVRHAMQLLADDGMLYVETPNRAAYGRHPNVPFYYFDPEHINHFAPRDFHTLAHSAGAHYVAGGEARISLADGSPYPVCWALLAAGAGDAPAVTASLPEDIEQYIEQQDALVQAWRAQVRAQLESIPAPWLVWGTGSQAQRVLAEGVIDMAQVAAFVDSDAGKQGRRLLDRDVLAPAEAFARWPGAAVVVLAANTAAAAIEAHVRRTWPQRSVNVLGAGGRALSHGTQSGGRVFGQDAA